MKSSSISRLAAVLISLAATGRAGVEPRRCPAGPGDAGWMEHQMRTREEAVAAEREKAIRLLRAFLDHHPRADQRAEALFRLAELHWERAEDRFLNQMRSFDQELDAFRAGRRKARPDQPRIDLGTSLAIYEEILEKHPDFSRTDTVLYLYGFGLNEQGDEQAALGVYKSMLQRFPNSAFVPDAHLAIAEYHFAKGQFSRARKSYEQVLSFDTPLLDLALYKTAWCLFKEGRAKQAATRFRQVLRRSREQKVSTDQQVEASAAALEKEALEDLALTFSESGGAREAYRFMKQVGGEEYSIRVLRQLGEVFFRQARYDKAVESFRILVERFPLAPGSPRHQARIAEAYRREGHMNKAVREHVRLAELFGPGSSWAKHNAGDPGVVERGRAKAEESLRFVATYQHQQAQQKQSPRAYRASAKAYRRYLASFAGSPHAPAIHFYLGEVLYKLGEFDQAAGHYGKALRKAKDEKIRREAAYAAVLSFDHLRQKSRQPDEPPAHKQELTPGEEGFVRAVDEFGRLAPDDPKLAQLRFEVAKVFYGRGHFDRASQHFLGVVQNHPGDRFAEPAADLALDCFTRSKDWETLEKRARRFKEAGTFRTTELGRKLPGIISAAIYRHGLQLAGAGKHKQAARELKRLVEEFPRDPLAPRALFRAAISLEQAGEKQRAVSTYRRIIERYPDRAAEATFVIAGIYERQYAYEKAAAHYTRFARRHPRDKRAPDALLQAALLHRATRAYGREAEVLTRFTREFKKHPEAPEALFRAGLALERADQHARAERIFASYLDKHAARQHKVRQANLHLGQARLALGRRSAARSCFERCGRFSNRRPPRDKELEAAAHCRFMLGELVFDEYKKIKLRPPKNRLVRLLKQKAALLKKAESLFTRVVEAGHMEWASAALYRIGDMYAQFAQAIYKAPMPKGLAEREQQVYRQELQSLAFPIEDKALAAFVISHQMARKHGYYSQWSRRTMEMLRRLDPGKYKKEEELRPGTAWADSFTTFPLGLAPIEPPKPKALRNRAGGKP